jgi:two-component system, NarL family, nitrate/nitrite response regulator NarL
VSARIDGGDRLQDAPLHSAQPSTPLLVASDVCLFREALAEALRGVAGLSLPDTADSCESVLRTLEGAPGVLVVFDAAMDGALDLVRQCVEARPDVRFVAVAVTETEHDVLACAEAGVAGYVAKDGGVSELVRTIEHVLRGELLCSPRMAGSLFRRLAAMSAERMRGAAGASDLLTQRERQIAALLDRGMSNKEIARDLCVEVATVKNHVHSILEKLQVHRRAEAGARFRVHSHQAI